MSLRKGILISAFLTILITVVPSEGTGSLRRVKRQTLMMVSNKICNRGQQVCGQLCFDPKLHSCQVAGPKKFLCNAGELACGDKCYDPTEASCSGNTVAGSSPGSGVDPNAKCPWGQRACGQRACFDPRVQSCYGDIVAKKNEKLIVPKVPQMVGMMTPFGPFPCASPGTIPCGAKCYDPQKQNCLHDFTPAGGTTKKPGGPIVCPVGNRRCVNRCYDPMKEYCPPSFLTQPKASPSGGLVNPYLFPMVPVLMPPTAVKSPPKCSPLQQRCGAKCFDPFGEKCLNGATVCKWNENVCGAKCFDPMKATCQL